jgi:TonB family protein
MGAPTPDGNMGRLPAGHPLRQDWSMSILSIPGLAAYLVVSVSGQAAISPPTPSPMDPSEPWALNYAQSMCILSRQYANNGKRFTLVLKPSPLNDEIRLGMLFAGTAKFDEGKAQISFDGHPPIEAPFMSSAVAAEGMYLVSIDTKRSELSGFDQSKVMWLRAGKFTFALKLADVAKALAALKLCEKDLIVHWGMDAKVVDSLATMPVERNVASVFRVDDYPSSAIAHSEQGTVGARFWVSKEGKISDCTVIESSGSKVLDQQTCSIIRSRARFDPARTQAGEAVACPSFVRIRWLLPDG